MGWAYGIDLRQRVVDAIEATEAEDPALLLYTSGSTVACPH